MATLTSGDRVLCWADHMRTIPVTETYPIIKTDLQAAINAVDQWISDNSVSYNNALPTAAKNNLSTSQKARLLVTVLEWRYLKGV